MKKIRKALIAGAGTAIATAQALGVDGLSYGELGQVAGAALVVGFLTWAFPNASPDEPVTPPVGHLPGMPGDAAE